MTQRLRTPHGELDLVLRDIDGRPHVIEVKSSSGFTLAPLISKTQIVRLRRATLSLTGRFKDIPRLHLAKVTREGEVIVFWDFGL